MSKNVSKADWPNYFPPGSRVTFDILDRIFLVDPAEVPWEEVMGKNFAQEHEFGIVLSCARPPHQDTEVIRSVKDFPFRQVFGWRWSERWSAKIKNIIGGEQMLGNVHHSRHESGRKRSDFTSMKYCYCLNYGWLKLYDSIWIRAPCGHEFLEQSGGCGIVGHESRLPDNPNKVYRKLIQNQEITWGDLKDPLLDAVAEVAPTLGLTQDEMNRRIMEQAERERRAPHELFNEKAIEDRNRAKAVGLCGQLSSLGNFPTQTCPQNGLRVLANAHCKSQASSNHLALKFQRCISGTPFAKNHALTPYECSFLLRRFGHANANSILGSDRPASWFSFPQDSPQEEVSSSKLAAQLRLKHLDEKAKQPPSMRKRKADSSEARGHNIPTQDEQVVFGNDTKKKRK